MHQKSSQKCIHHYVISHLFTHRMVNVCLTISCGAQYRESSYYKKEIFLTSGAPGDAYKLYLITIIKELN